MYNIYKLKFLIIGLLFLFIIFPNGVSAKEYPYINYYETLTTGVEAPLKIAVDDLGRIFISQGKVDRVTVHDMFGTYMDNFPHINQALAVATFNDKLFVSSGSMVEIYNCNTGDKTGALAYSFSQVNDIEVSSTGTLYIVDSKANHIVVFNAAGQFLFEFGAEGSEAGQFQFPVALALDESVDKVFVGDQGNSRIVVFDLDGNYLYSFGQRTYQDPVTFEWIFEGTFSFIQGLDCDKNGNLYVVDSYQSNVQVLDYSGNYLGTIGKFGSQAGEFKVPMDVVYHDDNLFVTCLGSGKVEIFDRMVTDVDEETDDDVLLPDDLVLKQNYPNPFNPSTHIDFSLPQSGNVTLQIFNILGQNVNTLVDGFLEKGHYSIEWQATDYSGNQVASGIYFYRLVEGVRSETRSMLLIK